MNPAAGPPGDAPGAKPGDALGERSDCPPGERPNGPPADPTAGPPEAATTSPKDFVRRLLKPPAPLGGYRELGTTLLARQLKLPEHQLGGHWCSRCQGIWWGTALEVECPACGNRNG